MYPIAVKAEAPRELRQINSLEGFVSPAAIFLADQLTLTGILP